MSIAESKIQELLSLAYIEAVTARAGYEIRDVSKSDHGIDGAIYEVVTLPNGLLSNSGWHFQFQAKATTTSSLDTGCVAYNMAADAYNKLAYWETYPPMLLLLFRLPPNSADWLLLDEDQLLLRNCCYWYRVPGVPTPNRSSVMIRVPREQPFTPDALQHLFREIRAGRL